MKKLMPYLRGHKRDIWLSAFCSGLESLFALLIPLAMAAIMDKGVQNADLAYTAKFGLLMTILALGVVVAGIYSMKYATRAGLGLGTDLRSAAYRRMQTFTFQNLESFGTASLITRLTTDVTTIQSTAIQAIKYLVRAPSMMVFSAVFSFMISPKLAWMFLALIPLVCLVIFIVILKIRPLYQRMQQAIDRLNRVVQENIIGMGVVKAFCRQKQQKAAFSGSNQAVFQTSDQAMGLSILSAPLGNLILYAGTIMLYWFGGRDIMAGTLTVGQLTGLSAYLTEILSRVLMLTNLSVMLSRSMISFQRLLEVTETVPEIADGAGDVQMEDGSIRLDQVDFHYDQSPMLLENLSLDIPAGQTVGIIGGTGSAKSTLVSLIPRLYDICGGSLQVGCHDIREYPLGTLREGISFVPQSSMLFSGTVRENLLWGKPDATGEELATACQAACADGFVTGLPQGYDTQIGQGGSNLSGGQRQRLCIARALLKDPKILILDDATSAVDMATDAAIWSAIGNAMPGVTKLIISQRISTIAGAERILVLNQGRLVGDGTHEQLQKTCDIYRELCQLQHYGEEGAYA